jgi:ribonuclease J
MFQRSNTSGQTGNNGQVDRGFRREDNDKSRASDAVGNWRDASDTFFDQLASKRQTSAPSSTGVPQQGTPSGDESVAAPGVRSGRSRRRGRRGGSNRGNAIANGVSHVRATEGVPPVSSPVKSIDATIPALSFEPDKKFASPRRPSAPSASASSAPHAQGGGSASRPKRVARMRPQPQPPVDMQMPGIFPGRKAVTLGTAKKKLRIIPVGGQEEVGRNMTIFEYENDIVIVDMGLQFGEEDMPGIDYIVPNVSYLQGKEHMIRGVIFTHGHLDHIGAAPILLRQLNYPTIIGRDFTLALIKHKVDDQEKGAASRLKMIRIKTLDDTIKLGVFTAKFFEVEHSIMDAVGITLETPVGTVIHMGDWTISNEPIDPHPISYEGLSTLPKPTFLMLESLGSVKKGLPPSETKVHENFRNLMKDAPGRLIIATFSSQVRRVSYLLEYVEQLGKKVALEGYSMKNNVEIAKELGYINVKQDTLITTNDIHKYPDKQVVVICTGAQGEANAALSRIVTDNHRFIKLQQNDTVVFSSSMIPGNERSVQRLKDNLYRKCDNVIHSDIMDIHIGGHSTAEGILEMLRQVKPTYFLPVYGNHFFLKEAAKLAYKQGYSKDRVFVLDNGHVLEHDAQVTKVLPKKIDSSYVFVDGLGIGDIGHVVLRDRQMLSQDGMIAITVIVDSKTKNVLGNVQITSRGFIHVKENFDLVNETKRKVLKVVKDSTSKDTSIDWRNIENNIREVVGQFLFTKTERRPMVLPVVVEV